MNAYFKRILTISISLLCLHASAQNVGINETGANPDASAILDINSPDKGILIPRTDTSTVNGAVTPIAGLLIYQNTDDVFYYHDGTKWVGLLTGTVTNDTLPLIIDTDRDTYVHTEENADEDLIRFHINGQEYVNIVEGGKINTVNTGECLHVGEGAGFNDNVNWWPRNTYIGHNVGYGTGATNGFDNVGLGAYALYDITTGDMNTAIGTQSLSDLTTGDNNVAVGKDVARFLKTGHQNTFMGVRSGFNNVSGSGNVFLGYYSGYNELGSNKLYIENSNSSTPLIWGDFANDSVKVYGVLGVQDNYVFPTVDGTSGQVMTTDGAGILSWSDAAVSDTLPLIIDADRDTYVHVEENADEDIIRFYDEGTERFRMNGSNLEVVNSNRCVYIGASAGLNSTGFGNSFLGFEAGRDNTSGNHNIAIGMYALSSNTTQSINTAIGNNALGQKTSGSYNVAVGYRSLISNVSGSNNTALGDLSGESNTGSNNVLIGTASGQNGSGSNNVYLGRSAGNNATGDNNIFLGRLAGSNANVSGQLYIENSSATNPLIWGDFTNDSVKVFGTLGVRDNYVFPNNDGTSGQIMTTDGAGNLSWSNVVTDTLPLIIDADGDTYIHVEETADEDIIRFGTSGTEYFNMNTGRLNVINTGLSVFIGENAGLNDDLTDNQQVFIGFSAGKNTTSGILNTFVGSNAGNKNTTGEWNTALGQAALNNNTTGNYNTAIGRLSLNEQTTGNRNATLGVAAMRYMQTGSNNTVMGTDAMRENINGNNNVVIGYLAGSGSSTGSGNVLIGKEAGRNQTISNNLYIENSSSTTPLIWGDFSNDSVKVYGTLGVRDNYVFPNNDGISGQVMTTDGAGNLSWTAIAADTDDQFADVFQLSGNNLELSLDGDGLATQSVDLSGFLDNTDNQYADVFQLNGNSLELSLDGDGIATQSVDLSAFLDADNLGNHTATQNVQTNGNWISNDGDNEGLYVDVAGNVGIGTSSPAGQVHLLGTTEQFTVENSINGRKFVVDAGGSTIDYYGTRFYINRNSTQNVAMVEGGGNVGIGTITPSFKLQVGNSGDGTEARANTWSTFSDRRWKTNFEVIPDALSKLDSIHGYYYNWKDKPDTSLQVGVIAQEIETILPEVVSTDAEGYKSVDYSKLSALLIQAVKEQQEIIAGLEQKNADLTKNQKNLEEANADRDALLQEILLRLQSLEQQEINTQPETAEK